MKMAWALLSLCLTLFFMNVDAALADQIQLKNGDHISGTLTRMVDNKVTFKTAYAGEISINWEAVTAIRTDLPVRVVLSDGTSLDGIIEPAENGKIVLRVSRIIETVSFDMTEVKSINPRPEIAEPAVKLKGHVNMGASVTRGNTKTDSYHIDAELIARTAHNRYTVGGEFNYAEDEGEKTVNKAIGYMKYDHFLNAKWYLYGNALFEKDEFKDLNFRAALGTGAGYQFFETPLTNLSVEAGLTYINEDFDLGQDDSYPGGRWALNFDRYLFQKAVQFFHFHEGFVGFEDAGDIFIRSRTGLRFRLYKNFIATTQFNFDWDNSPAPGREKSDEMFLLTLGYQF